MLIGAQTMMANSTNSTMGNDTMGNESLSSGLEACFKLTPEWGHMFRPIDDPDYPWLGLWTTLPIMGVWYWCTDQVSNIILTVAKQIYLWSILNKQTNKSS